MLHAPEGCECSHVPAGSTQVSAVQALPSLQLIGTPTHAPAPLQASEAMHPSPSLQPVPAATWFVRQTPLPLQVSALSHWLEPGLPHDVPAVLKPLSWH